jgi:hypothetical protein
VKTRIRIDPNIRVRGNHTLAERHDVDGPILVGTAVEVYEPEADIVGNGRVVEVDTDRDLIVLAVDWPSLRPRQRDRTPATRPSAGMLLVVEHGWARQPVSGCSLLSTAPSAPDLARVG